MSLSKLIKLIILVAIFALPKLAEGKTLEFDGRAVREIREVDQDFCAISRREKHGCDFNRRGQEAGVVGDELERRVVTEADSEHARVGAIEQSEAVW